MVALRLLQRKFIKFSFNIREYALTSHNSSSYEYFFRAISSLIEYEPSACGHSPEWRGSHKDDNPVDADRFDALSRLFDASATRRGIGAIGALLAAVALPGAGTAQVQAELCLRPGRRCDKGKFRRRLRCCGKAKCRKGRCRCKRRFKRCQGRCIPKTACCRDCGAGETCVNGKCKPDYCSGGDCTVFVTSTLHTGDFGAWMGQMPYVRTWQMPLD